MKTSILGILGRSSISLILLSLTFVALGLIMRPQTIRQKEEQAAPIMSVEVVPLVPHTTGIDFQVDGEVVPFRSLKVVPEVQGRVIFKSDQCRRGRSVKKGDLLLRIDPIDYELEVNQLVETLRQAKANIQENQVQLENTQRELKIAEQLLEIREKELQRYEQSKLPGVFSNTELDSVRSTVLNCRDTVQKLENQIRLFQTQSERLESVHRKETVNLDLARLNLRRTEVLAPISGIITTDDFEVNSYLQKGESVATLLDTSTLEIHCNLYMKQVQWLWRSKSTTSQETELINEDHLGAYTFPPTPVTIRYELEGDHWEWTGSLQTLDGSGMDAATRMIPCRVRVDRPQAVRLGTKMDSFSISIPPPTLLSGMYVSIIVHAKPDIPLYKIPEKALHPGNKIWTATDGILHQHPIRVATTTKEGVLFYAESENLKPNDWVVVSPLAHSGEGAEVRLSQNSVQITQSDKADRRPLTDQLSLR